MANLDENIRSRKKLKKRDSDCQEKQENVIIDKLNSFSPTIRNFIIRAVLTIIMLFLLPILIFGDFIFTYIIILIITFQCYREYIRVGVADARADKIPLIRSFAYYIFFVTQYTFVGEFPLTYLQRVIPESIYSFLVSYGTFMNFWAFMGAFIVFVLTLKKHYYKRQFNMFGWFLLGSTFLGCSARCLFKNIQQGLIWAYLPMSLIVMNDIFAYIFGTIFGRTPLIRISPKKTWEGFIGSAIVTLIGGIMMTFLFTRFDYFICPYRFSFGEHQLNITCNSPTFLQLQTFQFPTILTLIFPERISSFEYYPIYIHTVVICTFVSLLAPFGGFFASGFKRAHNIKDFGHTFPGHGGMLDRMDCQFLITIFINVYTKTFFRNDQVTTLFNKIKKLSADEMIQFYNLLKNHLENIGAINI